MSKIHSQPINKTPQPIPSASESNYEDDDFESMTLSKSMGGFNNGLPTIKAQNEITCFDCKQKIPKAQAGSHKDICPKAVKRLSLKKSIDSEQNSERKYSPIRETKKEDLTEDDEDESAYTSVQESESLSISNKLAQSAGTRKH